MTTKSEANWNNHKVSMKRKKKLEKLTAKQWKALLKFTEAMQPRKNC